MKRIMIIGSPGSGKTILAKKLATKTKLPLIHLDHLYWLPNFKKRSDEDYLGLVMQACRHDSWIMDGNSIRQLAKRISFADTIIFLDIPRKICIWRIIKRNILSIFTSEEFAPGCKVRARWGFFCYVWRWEKKYREEVLRVIATATQTKAILLKSPDEVTAFLQNL
jgi:adenylate kinase family enzyme